MSLRFHFYFLSMLLPFLAASRMQSIKTWVQNGKQFYREVRTEMKIVTWPDRREVAGTTVIVLVVAILSGIYLSIMDEVSRRAIGWIMRYFGVTPPE